jgi:hypothetical protein
MVDFEAYALDCRVVGQIELSAPRLSDQLDGTAPLLLRAVQVQGHANGQLVDLPELQVEREELCAVIASGNRGDAARRVVTRRVPVVVDVGPYSIEGMVHGPRAGDPFAAVLKRGQWLPLTQVRVSYQRQNEPVEDEIETLLVNRSLMTRFRRAATLETE